jgi:hypothetical protein
VKRCQYDRYAVGTNEPSVVDIVALAQPQGRAPFPDFAIAEHQSLFEFYRTFQVLNTNVGVTVATFRLPNLYKRAAQLTLAEPQGFKQAQLQSGNRQI